MISLCGGTKTITDPAVDLGIESIITLIGLHTHFCSKRIGRLHEWPALHVLHQADHVAVDSTGKAMVALSVLIKFQTRSLLVMAIETIGLSILVHVEAMKLSHLNDVQSALHLFYEICKIMSFVLSSPYRACVWINHPSSSYR